MGENTIFVNCEKCGKLYGIDIADAEETGREGKDYLCSECAAKDVQPEPRKRFEYQTVPYITNGEPKGGTLNDYGAEGWELAAVIRGRFIFKREYFG